MGYLYHINWSTGEFAGETEPSTLYHPSFFTGKTQVTERSDHHWHAFAFALHLDQAPKKKIAGLEVVKFFGGGVVHDSPRWKQSQFETLTLDVMVPKKCKLSTLVWKSGSLQCFDSFYML